MRPNRRTIESFVKKVVTAEPGDTLASVAQLMEQHNVGAVVVVEHRKPVGIVTDRDLALQLGARGVPAQTAVVKIMKQPIRVVYRDDGVFDVTEAMVDNGVRRLPVVDNDEQLVGLVTLDDLLRVLSRELSNLAQGIQSEMEVK